LRNYEELDFYLNGWENPYNIIIKKKEKPIGVCFYQTLRYPPKLKPISLN
jgi:hypothetical protein